MILQITAFWVVLLIILVHTGIQHLLNWGFRNAHGNGDLEFGLVLGTIFEFVLLLVALNYTLVP
jgi:hypothetical protein